jgi:hypothetical protein
MVARTRKQFDSDEVRANTRSIQSIVTRHPRSKRSIARFDHNEGCDDGRTTLQFDCDEGRPNDSVVRDDDREPLHRPRGCSRTKSVIVRMITNAQVWLRRWSHDLSSSVAMRIASECLERKDSRESASSITTMVARTIKFVRDDDRERSHRLRGCSRMKEFDCDNGRTSFQA